MHCAHVAGFRVGAEMHFSDRTLYLVKDEILKGMTSPFFALKSPVFCAFDGNTIFLGEWVIQFTSAASQAKACSVVSPLDPSFSCRC